MENLRNFEISIWTLQDRFITVLEDSYNKLKGKMQDATMTLNIDGTQELTFTIPMKFDVGDHYVTNPAWISAVDGKQLLVNTRKVKVILNKKTEEEEIHEFVIDKVTERHENDQMYCDITCSGLAFYELGKIGYKISLTSEDFYADDLKWFYKEEENGERIFVEQPIANIQYWLNKFLTPLNNQDNFKSEENVYESFKWYYALQMDWTHYFNYPGWGHSKHKIYEDTPEYEEQFSPQADIDKVGAKVYAEDGVAYKEKARLVDLEESNIYNLTQNIAEIFEVFCRYEYIYDDNYHIIGRVVVFYNSFLLDDNQLSITYRNQTSSITRETDSTDLVTKMYVKTVDENDDTVSIIDVEDNPTGEDYILNFDYLHSIGTITDEQYEYVKTFSDDIKEINQILKPLAEKKNNLELKIIDVEAKKATAEAAAALDKEQITATDALLNNLTNNTGELYVTETNPEFCVLRQSNDNLTYYINLTTTGIKAETVKVYLQLNSANLKPENPINATPEYDDYGNLVRLKNINKPSGIKHNHAYLTYTYEPQLYYENIKKTWVIRQQKDIAEAKNAEDELTALKAALEDTKQQYKDQLDAKQEALTLFEEMLGPAIREGYWQPENYSDSGDIHVSNYTLNKQAVNDIEEGSSPYDYFVWDTNLIEGEQDIKYKIGLEERYEGYRYIDLQNYYNQLDGKINEYSFLFYDYDKASIGETDYDINKIKSFSIGSQAILHFTKTPVGVFPALLITGGENFPDETWNIIANNCYLGKLSTEFNSTTGQVQNVVKNQIQVTLRKFDPNSTYNQSCYPRIYVESLSMKNSEDQLALTLGDVPLENFKDYYVTTRIKPARSNSSTDIPMYAITVKNEFLFNYILCKTDGNHNIYFNNRLSILFSLSNADSAIYNDALTISHESAYPQVTYEFNYDIFKNGCLRQPSKYLNHIVKVNDYELKFEGVRGYISGITAVLDRPWEDTLEIKNYRTKFEDLFSNILAQTEAMKKNEHVIDYVSRAFGSDGQLQTAVVQKTLTRKDLNFAFNEGNLTIDEKNGIWGVSDSGVVAMRGGGIFTATEKDENENWIWNTGILPTGIDASSITTGQLDTNRIKIYAGDKLRLQMNDKGLFAYKSFFEDVKNLASDSETWAEAVSNKVKQMALISNGTNTKIDEDDESGVVYTNQNDLDPMQYVKFDENGLFLIAENGALVLNEDKNDYKKVSNKNDLNANSVERVSISWDGLTLRNYDGKRTFYADADSGDLILEGTVYAENGQFNGIITSNEGQIGPWHIDSNAIYMGNESINPLLGQNNIIYFGKQGLSFYNTFKIQLNNRQELELFTMNDNNNDNDYLFKIQQGEDGSYDFNIRRVTFNQELVNAILNFAPRRREIQCFKQGSSGASYDENLNNGILQIYYGLKSSSGGRQTINLNPIDGDSISTGVALTTITDAKKKPGLRYKVEIKSEEFTYFNIYYNTTNYIKLGKINSSTYGYYCFYNMNVIPSDAKNISLNFHFGADEDVSQYLYGYILKPDSSEPFSLNKAKVLGQMNGITLDPPAGSEYKTHIIYGINIADKSLLNSDYGIIIAFLPNLAITKTIKAFYSDSGAYINYTIDGDEGDVSWYALYTTINGRMHLLASNSYEE